MFAVTRYTRPSNFSRHCQYCHKNPTLQMLHCPKCDVRFARVDNLKRHEMTCNGKQPHHDPFDTSDDHERIIQKFNDEGFSIDDLFNITVKEMSGDDHAMKASETKFTVSLTQQGKILAKHGHLADLVTKIFEHTMKTTNARKNSNVSQIVIEGSGIDYPITSGLELGNKLEISPMLDRVAAVSQSRRIMQLDDANPELEVTIFNMPT